MNAKSVAGRRRRYVWIAGCLFTLSGVLWGVTQSSAQDDGTLSEFPGPQSAADATTSGELKTLREGSQLVDEVGVFKTSGDRAFFETIDGRQRFVALENLNLERIMRMVGESTGQLAWTVSGGVTEYHGGNFLLVSRAYRKLSPIEPGTAAAVLDEPPVFGSR